MKKKKALLVICRHGQTEYNRKNLMTGQLDIPLTELGEAQARQTGTLLNHITFDKIYSSTLSRAFNTASLLLEHTHNHHHLRGDDGWEIEKRDEIVEKNTGDFTGRNHKTDPEIKAWPKDFDKKHPNGESPKDVAERVKAFYEAEILPRIERGENVLVVCHAGVVHAFQIVLGMLEEGTSHPKVANTVPHVFEYEEGVLQKHYLIAHPSEKSPNRDKGGPKPGLKG